MGLSLGHKGLRTHRYDEKLDSKVLEVMIDLDGGQEIPLNLRVDVSFG